MKNINDLFFELIQVSIGTRICLSHTPSASEWGKLYSMAKKQSLVGVCFAGVKKLVEQQQEPPEMLYLTWMGMAAKIQQRNEVVNKQCVELQEKLAADGFHSYIMKGQGNSFLYGEFAMLRQSGDIDVYLEGGLDKVLAYANMFAPTNEVNELEMHVKVYDDTEVEFHYRPFIMRNPIKNARLQSFFKDAMRFDNKIALPNDVGLINVPTTEFNLVHQMVHIYHHLMTEGVGMRQLMDYNFLLCSVPSFDSTQEPSSKVRDVIRDLGLDRFASALMWVLGYVFGLKREQMLWNPCEEDGKMLLEDIVRSGNFGNYDEKMASLGNKWISFWYVSSKTLRFWRFDHWAWFWSPLWRIYHFCWRKMKGFN